MDLVTYALCKKLSGDGSGLPNVTAVDNGKVLGVENGAWGKMDAPSGLPDVTQNDNEKILIVENGEWAVATADNVLDASSTKPISNTAVYTGLTNLETMIYELQPIVRACDSTAQSVLEQMTGSAVGMVTPIDIKNVGMLLNLTATGYLLWTNGTKLDNGKVLIEMDLTNNAITLYARGKSSMVSGVMGVDTSWTVTSL